MAEKQGEKPKMPAEMMKKATSIAEQAALRAQQMKFKQKLCAVQLSDNHSSAVAALKKPQPPQVPARGDSVLTKKPPEIPPKRTSLKKPDGSVDIVDSANKTPPPLPQKPSSVQNSPLLGTKRPVPPTPQMPCKFDRPPANLPQTATNASTNPFSSQMNSPQLNQRFNQNSVNNHNNNNGMQVTSIAQRNSVSVSTASSSSASSKIGITTPAKKLISPIDDFSSEDALRGIESGLRNMERAMQEQMNMRSLEMAAAAAAAIAAQAAKNDKRNFNPIDFKRNIGGSVTSLDGSGNNGASAQNLSVIESMRMVLGKNLRSMERGFSMDQMRLDQMHLTNSMRALEANSGNGNTAQRPNMIENHMKSLDRSLPLELQYSRHTRSQSQQESVEKLRQNVPNQISSSNATGVSREDMRLRRRSSHDENQISQAQNNNAGINIMYNIIIINNNQSFRIQDVRLPFIICAIYKIYHLQNENTNSSLLKIDRQTFPIDFAILY